MLQIEPTHRHQPPQRHELPAYQYPRRQPPPTPLTLESFSVYVEQRFNRLEHLIETGQDRQEDALRYIMSRHSMGILDFFRSRQQGSSASTAESFDPIPPIRVFGKGSSGAGGREESNHESDSEHDEDECGDSMRMQEQQLILYFLFDYFSFMLILILISWFVLIFIHFEQVDNVSRFRSRVRG
ncbi:hypothetical protein Hanom_Chr02g00157911 [Helianthus anomalus]